MNELRGAHRGTRIAVLGSGPTLAMYAGQVDLAIAVNGAAHCEAPYQYFTCGDVNSPMQSWFYASRKHSARRIIASFLAPMDTILYPDIGAREAMLSDLASVTSTTAESTSLPPYEYIPSVAPSDGHRWFQYAFRRNAFAEELVLEGVRTGRLLPGATIAGVALQMAAIMGASEVHLFGCSMDNDCGDNYLHRGMSSGSTKETQRVNFAAAIRAIRTIGVEVEIHGESRLNERLG